MTEPAVLQPHPFSTLLPAMPKQDFEELVADIKANGLHQPILRYQGKVMDGNHRYRACVRLGIKPQFADFDGTDAQARAYVISANIHRRHLSPEQKRELIATLLKDDPTKSDRQIGEQTKADHKTVGAVRAELEVTGEIPQLETTTGKDGKKRTTPKGGTKKKQTVTKVKASYNRYQQSLFDAVDDLIEVCSVVVAEQYVSQTKSRLDEKIKDKRDEEAEKVKGKAA
jgi:ParB-like nuclease domain